MDRVAIVARFPAEQREAVKGLLAAGPPYDLADAGIERHAVYLSGHEVVFVFEGAEVEWEVEDLADDFFHPEIRASLSHWRTLLEQEPHLARPVFAWERGSPAPATATAAAPPRVGDVMDADVVKVAPEDTLGEAVEQIVAHGDRPALVVDYGRLIGVLAAHDVLRAVAERVHPSDARAREWMTEPVGAVEPETSLDAAAAAMVEHGHHHLPVVAGERAVGVVALHELVRALRA